MTKQELDVLLANLRNKVIDKQQIDIESILALLYHAEASVKFAAVEVLAELADERAVDHLYAIAQNEEISLAVSAIEALGEVGGEAATNALIAAMDDTLLRQYSLRALAKIGGPKVITILIDSLKFSIDEDRDDLFETQEGLKFIGKAALEPLIAALSHKNDIVRYNAALILEEIGGKPVIEAFKAALITETDEVNRQQLRSILDSLTSA